MEDVSPYLNLRRPFAARWAWQRGCARRNALHICGVEDLLWSGQRGGCFRHIGVHHCVAKMCLVLDSVDIVSNAVYSQLRLCVRKAEHRAQLGRSDKGATSAAI